MESKHLVPDTAASTAAALLMPVAVVAGIAAGAVILTELFHGTFRPYRTKNRRGQRHTPDSYWLSGAYQKNFNGSPPAPTPALKLLQQP